MKYWKPRMRLSGPGYFYGRTESGKTWKMIALAQVYHSKFNYKIFDIGSGKRKENTFWCFPSDEKILWRDFENEVGDMKNTGPKQYKVKLLYPCFSLKLPNKIPQNLPNIESQVFTIYFKDITIEDIAMIIGDPSKNSVHLWNKIVKDLPPTATGTDIDEYINKYFRQSKELSIYKLFIKPAIDYNLLASKDCFTNLNLIKEAKEKEVISVLCHDYIPNTTWEMFIMGFMMRRLLFDLAMNDKIPHTNIALFREAGDYMKKVDKDLEAGEQVQIFRNSLTKIARYGRSGLILFMDTQSPADTKNLIEGQEDLLCINEISILDIKEILEKLRAERRLSRYIKDKLHDLQQKEMVIVERKQKAILVNNFQPPRCMCYKGRSFLKIWKDKVNSWKRTEEDLNIIKEEYKTASDKISRKKVVKQMIENPIQVLPEKRKEVIKELEEEEIII